MLSLRIQECPRRALQADPSQVVFGRFSKQYKRPDIAHSQCGRKVEKVVAPILDYRK